jgi:hypothetical protein
MPNLPSFLMLQKAYVEIKYFINVIDCFFQYLGWLTGVSTWLIIADRIKTTGIMAAGMILLKCLNSEFYYSSWIMNITDIRSCFSSVIIVAQPTGPDGVPVTYYTKNNLSPSAKLNVRIICLLNPDVLQNYIELSNIGINHTIIFYCCLYC